MGWNDSFGAWIRSAIPKIGLRKDTWRQCMGCVLLMLCQSAETIRYLTERSQFDEKACYYCSGYFCCWIYHLNGSIFLGRSGTRDNVKITLTPGIKDPWEQIEEGFDPYSVSVRWKTAFILPKSKNFAAALSLLRAGIYAFAKNKLLSFHSSGRCNSNFLYLD